MPAQLELAAPRTIACEWCAAAPAERRVHGTDACASCAALSANERVLVALQRWSRNR